MYLAKIVEDFMTAEGMNAPQQVAEYFADADDKLAHDLINEVGVIPGVNFFDIVAEFAAFRKRFFAVYKA